MSDLQGETPFQRWVDAARPRAQIWRTIVGIILIGVIWMVWTLALMFGSIGLGLVDPDAFQAMFGMADIPLTYTDTIVMLLISLATIWGFSLGVWLVARLLHKRSFSSVVAWDRRFSLSQFGVGCLIAAGYLAVSMTWSFVSGHAPTRSELALETWLLALAPVAIVVFVQAASEELVFRGYLPQQLAGRFGSAIVWGFIPSVLFGLMHAANSPGNQTYALYYIAIASIMGMVMMAMVWRTGSLAAAIGFHFINNVGALTLAGSDQGPSSIALFVWTPEQMMASASGELLIIGLLLAFVFSPFAPLPKGQSLARRK
ncbi:MAG: CPBP family intramembrane glutamic endopeptidase [Sphingobium sp.]